MKKDYIYEAFHKQPIISIKNKKYCVNTLTDHSPVTESKLLDQIMNEMSESVDYSKADILIGEEDRGGYLCALASYVWKKPFSLTKWNPSGLEGEVSVDFKNTYASGQLYINGLKRFENKKAIIVEDLIDSGGTIIAMIELLRKNNVEVIDVIAVAEKSDYYGVERIQKETGITPKVLVKFNSNGELSEVTSRFNK